MHPSARLAPWRRATASPPTPRADGPPGRRRPVRRRVVAAAAAVVVGLTTAGVAPAWADDTYQVHIEVVGDGTAAVVGGGTTFSAGDTVQLTATPDSDATVWGGWTSDELDWIGARVDEFTMPAGDVHLTSSFRDRAPALQDVYQDRFDVGAIWGTQTYTDPQSSAIVDRDYGVMTAENAMKPEALLPNGNIGDDGSFTFDFATADAFVDQTLARGMRVHGHVLVWHSQSPARLNSGATGGTRAQARDNMERYISEVLTHYSGQIQTWDVVNEAFVDGIGDFDPATEDWRDYLRGGPNGGASNWYQAYANGADASLGETAGDFIYDAFVLARQYGPEAQLQYNDFNLFQSSGKARAAVAMATELNARYAAEHPADDRLLIEVMGMQSHDYINQTPAFACTGSLAPELVDATAEEWQAGACSDAESLEASIRMFQDAGLEVAISELDLQVFESWDGMPQGPNNNDLSVYYDLTDPSVKDLYHRTGADYWVGKITNRAELEAIQAQRYAEFFSVFDAYSDGIERVTFWGLTDAQSWRRNHNPLTRNQDYSEKLAAWAVADPAGWYARDDVAPEPEPEPEPVAFGGTVSATQLAPGDEFSITGVGATPEGAVRAELHSVVTVLGSVAAAADGSYALLARVPAATPAGAHTVVVVDEATGASWTIPVTVVAAPAAGPGGADDVTAGVADPGTADRPSGLAATGTSVAGALALAGALLAAGAAGVVAVRRRAV